MIIFDFFAGTGSATKAFKDAGHTVISFELSEEFEATENVDVFTLSVDYLLKTYGQPDFVWASPPCTAFSVASIGKHWGGGARGYEPKTEAAVHNQKLVSHVRMLAEELKPQHGFLIENPRGMLRKLPPVKGLERVTVTYCAYGDTRQKPTDLFGKVEGWQPRPACKRGAECHEAAPRGSKTGTQGLKNAKVRSMLPYSLGQEILSAIEGKLK